MHIIITLVVGLIVGALAKLVMPGRDPGGALVTMLLGVAGAFVAGMLGHALGWYAVGLVVVLAVGAVKVWSAARVLRLLP